MATEPAGGDFEAGDGPVRRRKLSDAVRDRLLEMLDGGRLEPGDVLPSERQLMARFEVGRPAVREAMQSLQGMGLIEVRHGERPRVARATVEVALDQIDLTMRHALSHSAPTLEHLKEVRLATETHLARLAARLRTDEDVARLHETLGRQEAAAGLDVAAFVRLDGAFHARIAVAAGNPIFVSVTHAIFDWLSRFHVSAVHSPGLEQLTIDEHRAIFQRIAARDGHGASRAMRLHLVRANSLYATGNRSGS